MSCVESYDYKYFSLPKTKERIYENNLSEIYLKTNIFEKIYSEIKEKCNCYARGEEKGVSYLYKYNYLQNNNIILLDIEYSTKSESDNTSDRIDIVLYDKINKSIQFVEAKQYANKELDNLDVINQIERYNKNIVNSNYEHLLFYKEYIEVLNNLFNIKLPIPEKINENVSLYMFDFSAMDKNNEKFINININIKNKYFRGNPDTITNENLKQLFTI